MPASFMSCEYDIVIDKEWWWRGQQGARRAKKNLLPTVLLPTDGRSIQDLARQNHEERQTNRIWNPTWIQMESSEKCEQQRVIASLKVCVFVRCLRGISQPIRIIHVHARLASLPTRNHFLMVERRSTAVLVWGWRAHFSPLLPIESFVKTIYLLVKPLVPFDCFIYWFHWHFGHFINLPIIFVFYDWNLLRPWISRPWLVSVQESCYWAWFGRFRAILYRTLLPSRL